MAHAATPCAREDASALNEALFIPARKLDVLAYAMGDGSLHFLEALSSEAAAGTLSESQPPAVPAAFTNLEAQHTLRLAPGAWVLALRVLVGLAAEPNPELVLSVSCGDSSCIATPVPLALQSTQPPTPGETWIAQRAYPERPGIPLINGNSRSVAWRPLPSLASHPWQTLYVAVVHIPHAAADVTASVTKTGRSAVQGVAIDGLLCLPLHHAPERWPDFMRAKQDSVGELRELPGEWQPPPFKTVPDDTAAG